MPTVAHTVTTTSPSIPIEPQGNGVTSTSLAPSAGPSMDVWEGQEGGESSIPRQGPDGIVSDEPPPPQTDGSNLSLALGVGIPAILALIIAGFFVSRRQMAAARNLRLSDTGMYGSAASSVGNVLAAENRRIAGTGDPPGSFHEGLYHYMSDGTRYLSTNCPDCLETRKNSFYTDDNLGTIPEDQEYEDVIFGHSYYTQDEEEEVEEIEVLGGGTSTYLGHLVRGHSVARPNVHVCNSALCPCRKNQQATTFLESPAMWLARGAAANEPMDSLLTFGSDDVTSSRSGRQEV